VRVVETFGPTIQGEGPYAGRVCHFLRLGGCDYRCSWCDTPHAVLPELVREAENLTPEEVSRRLDTLDSAPMLVISGGNPALHKLDALLDLLDYEVVAVETQGSRWRDWLERADSLVVSPKPPSSGEATTPHRVGFGRFMYLADRHPGLVLKVVVFDDADLAWALGIHRAYPGIPFYLTAGTDQDPRGERDLLETTSARYRWLCEQVAGEPELHRVVVLPQLHVIACGSRVGV
jgi:7-carboxy-7-deazaguanine synthase